LVQSVHSYKPTNFDIGHYFNDISKSLTNVAMSGSKPSFPDGYTVVGVDGRGSGVTVVLQDIIETLVHITVVPIRGMTYTMTNYYT